MKTLYLFPNRYKKLGWIILLPAFIIGLILFFTDYEYPTVEITVFSPFGESGLFSKSIKYFFSNNIIDEIVAVLLIIGGVLVGFSKEKIEDEYIAKIRIESLVWAVYINYTILILAILLLYGFSFLHILIFNMFTVLFIFIIRFQYLLFKNKKALKDEK